MVLRESKKPNFKNDLAIVQCTVKILVVIFNLFWLLFLVAKFHVLVKLGLINKNNFSIIGNKLKGRIGSREYYFFNSYSEKLSGMTINLVHIEDSKYPGGVIIMLNVYT